MQGSAKRSANTMQKLPSQFQLGEFVKLEISKDNCLLNGQIAKIHFSPSKVLYDLDFKVIELEGKSYSTRIHNVDSAFVKREEPIIWDGDSTTANKLFGDRYGKDWAYLGDTSDIVVSGNIIRIGDKINRL